MADLIVRAAGLMTIGLGVIAGILADGVRTATGVAGPSALEFVLVIVSVTLMSAGTLVAFCGRRLLEGSRWR
ncbi:hypothetical protein [Novosphingobium album (ex Liu et al. 2023)]|uniref:Uncharacterized protein n=1 Tax=Novosphingobium album (ex Liu et al. 2023) TaxID=3031130 RepID=A0ABT5WNM6_9SPHN|nr:hypothetical protein [Novosphingobium album (ex Liu et al. 2023)]MDE8651479.1 hypothetical protein [Novosphingobium album (ex Liu et al. 2023)]